MEYFGIDSDDLYQGDASKGNTDCGSLRFFSQLTWRAML
jgi:hypothetical protein